LVQKVSKPLGNLTANSGKSILDLLNKKEEKHSEEESTSSRKENLPQNHFTETDLQSTWNLYLKNLQVKDLFTYNAINGFRLAKKGENNIEVQYPSDTAKVEFDRISGEFFNHFRRKVNNFSIEIEFKKDEKLKVEMVTKRSIFEKMVEKNPLLKDLDDLLKFDLN
jgi:DNA polymerase-3 subunit gamma/tau